MYKLTTFEKIGEQHNLPDDIIDTITNFYMKHCLSYENTLKYYTNRQIFMINNDYHHHRINMHFVDCEFKFLLRKFLSYQNLLVTFGNQNITFHYINQQLNDMLFDTSFEISLETHMLYNMKNFIKFLRNDKK